MKLSITVGLKLTEMQRTEWEAMAAEEGRTLSSWIRYQVNKRCKQIERQKHKAQQVKSAPKLIAKSA